MMLILLRIEPLLKADGPDATIVAPGGVVGEEIASILL